MCYTFPISSLFLSQPPPLLLTVESAVSLLCSERAQHYTVKLGHNPLNGTHTSVLHQGQQPLGVMCALFVCACAGSVLLCIVNVRACSHEKEKEKRQLKPQASFRSTSSPIITSRKKKQPQISTQPPSLHCFRGNIALTDNVRGLVGAAGVSTDFKHLILTNTTK